LDPDSVPYRFATEVVEAGRAGTQWIQKLQLFSRRRPVEFWPANLATVLGEEESRLRDAWRGRVTLHVALAANLPPVAIEKESLRHVLVQVLDNAGEAISEHGVVTVSASVVELNDADSLEMLGQLRAGSYVELLVSDTGCGLSDDVRQRLFRELFFSSKPRHRGLGLAMVYGILRTYGGGMRIVPHSEQGTAVHLYLPIAPVTGRTMVPGQPFGPRVLIVDDNRTAGRQLCAVLERAGYRAQAATTALDALQLHLSAAEGFELVVADLQLTRASGFDLVGRMRETQPRLCALFLSKESAGLTTDAATDLLPKPFRPEELIRKVRAVLEAARHATQALGTEKGS
jgi:CheY-like chemotaxis protein